MGLGSVVIFYIGSNKGMINRLVAVSNASFLTDDINYVTDDINCALRIDDLNCNERFFHNHPPFHVSVTLAASELLPV